MVLVGQFELGPVELGQLKPQPGAVQAAVEGVEKRRRCLERRIEREAETRQRLVRGAVVSCSREDGHQRHHTEGTGVRPILTE